MGAKNSTATTTIPDAVRTKNLTIFDKAQVTRIVTDSNGRGDRRRLHSRSQGVFSARQDRAARRSTLTKTRACYCFRSRKRIPTAFPTITVKLGGIISDTGSAA